jgi:hypothetical protein
MLKKTMLTIVCVLLGCVFLFSAYTKIYPIEPFEYTFVDLGIANWQLSPFMARVLIGLEFLIGALLILNIALKKIAYPIGVITLLVFCVYLIIQLLISGNTGNCGCFGVNIFMTPLQALLKNIAMLVVFVILYKYHNEWNFGKIKSYILIVVVLVSVALPFILNPIKLDYSEAYLNKAQANYVLKLDTLYNNALINTPPKELSKGKWIVAFMSLTCPHCRIAAKKIRILKERDPSVQFYFVLNGKEENLNSFFDDTKTKNIPYSMLKGQHFIYLAGVSLPSIYMINNSIVAHEVNYITLDENEIRKWLSDH